MNWTTDVLVKFVPLTVRTNAGSPAATLGGEIVVTVGNGLLTVKFNAGVDTPPPGNGFVTVTGITPAVNSSAAVISTLTWVASIKVAGWLVAPKLTVVPVTKLVPVIVIVTPASPTSALVGERLVAVGIGLLTVKFNAGVEVPPPGVGFVTVTGFTPAVATSVAFICTVRLVELTIVGT